MSQWTRWILALLLPLILLSGCGSEPVTAEAAVASARAFLKARVAGDAGTVYAALATRAQEAMTPEIVANYLQQMDTSFGEVGTPVEVEPGLLRVPVKDLVLTDEGRSIRWSESWLTLIHEGEWRIAWAEPLHWEAEQAYHNDLLVEELDLARRSIAVDPYHYRGYLELHFAYRELKRFREAEVALVEALTYATPAELPVVHDATARFKLVLKQPGEGLTHAQTALSLAAPYMPDTYSPRWQADSLVVAGRAALALNDPAAAEQYAAQAEALDPQNSSLALLRYQLATTPSPSTGQ